jgi:hypothetical protein
MPIDMLPVPVKRGTASLSLLVFARATPTNAGWNAVDRLFFSASEL